MLKSLRKNTKAVIWTVVIAFALWGGYSVSSQLRKETMYAGNVFGKNVSFQEFGRFYQATQILSTRQETTPPDPEQLRTQTWQSIIFSREAKRLKIEVSDDEVRKQVLELLEKQKVDPEFYPNWIERAFHETPQEFEEQVRELQRIQKFMNALKESTHIIVTDDEAKEIFKFENQKLSVAVMRFPEEQQAKAFRAKVKNSADWTKETQKQKADEIPLAPLPNLAASLQLSGDNVQKLYALQQGMISEVTPIGKGFGVFRVVDKTFADDKQFAVQKSQYTDQAKDKHLQFEMMKKTADIIGRADLKDYQSSPPPEKSKAA